jgi:uncharacterized protein YciI
VPARSLRVVATFAVTLAHGPGWDASRQIRDQVGWTEHAQFMDALVADGFIVVGGPLGDGQQTLHAVDAADEQAIRARLSADPWARDGLLVVAAIEPWALWLDCRQPLAAPGD